MSIRRTTLVLQRFSFAFCILVLMPTGVVQTVKEPSGYHEVLLIACALWTMGMYALYRRAVAKWLEDDDD